MGGRTTGVYTIDDFQSRCPCPANQALLALQAVNLCVRVSLLYKIIYLFAKILIIAISVKQCEVDDDEIEYELPCLNLVEKLPGLWEPWKNGSTTLPHAGFRLCPGEAPLYHLNPIFPHLQVREPRKDSIIYQ